MRTDDGETALALADSKGHKKTAKMLRTAGKWNSLVGNQGKTYYITTSKTNLKNYDADH